MNEMCIYLVSYYKIWYLCYMEIIIHGTAGSGKSTIARLIEQTLEQNGFNVLVNDKDFESTQNRKDLIDRDFDNRLKAIVTKSTSITISETQANKNSQDGTN